MVYNLMSKTLKKSNVPEITDLLRYWPMLDFFWRESIRIPIGQLICYIVLSLHCYFICLSSFFTSLLTYLLHRSFTSMQKYLLHLPFTSIPTYLLHLPFTSMPIQYQLKSGCSCFVLGFFCCCCFSTFI
jgi:hypothetical protein